jgi:hypothetical protein
MYGNELSYGPPADKQEMISLIRSAVERGITFCGQGVIATKFGFNIDPQGSAPSRARIVARSGSGRSPRARSSASRLMLSTFSISIASTWPQQLPNGAFRKNLYDFSEDL